MLTKDEAASGFDLAMWSRLAHSGSNNAIAGLSKMINREITVREINLEEVLARNVASLIGNANDYVVGIYLSFSGATSGHIMLAFQPRIAYELVDMIIGLPLGSAKSMGEMERSAIGEAGNIVSAFFLNTIADNTGQSLLPSPPLVFVDTVGAIFDSVMADILKQNKPIFGIKMSFSTQDREIEGRFLVLPTLD